jgi:hypothetical protein
MLPKWNAAFRKGAEVSLTGNLGFVALDEVLRLLSRSNQQGAVDVRGDGVHGRIFMGKRGIDLATTYEDEELRRHLIRTGLIDEAHLRAAEGGQASLASDNAAAIVALIREMTVESIHQLSDRGSHFEVYEHTATPYASPSPFELEEILAAARRRAEDWKTVRRTIPDLDAAVDFARDIGDREEVKMGADAWKVITEIRGGSSVTDIADRLGTTEFWAARVVADLVGKNLLDLANGAISTEVEDEMDESPEDYASPYDTPERMDEKAPEDQFESEDEYEDEGTADEAVDEELAGATGHNQSWWKDPETKEDSTAAEGGDVEEDTEAFLEKVFSELDETDPEQEGHGLLRRRRLGALRDLSGDS